jgi:tetratricopeptide (TPR) repeat protein
MRSKISERGIVAGICAGLIALVWFVFGQAIHFPFVNYDDAAYTSENPIIVRGLSSDGIVWAFTHTQSGNWHPLTVISHMLDCSLFGLNAGAHHLINVSFHTLTVLAFFFALRALTGSLWRSALVAAIFAIHPLRAESVVWIAERKDVLSGFFFALTLGTYAWYVQRPSLGRYLTISILFACGLMAKPMLVTTPVILLLMDYWPLGRARTSHITCHTSQQLSWSKLIVEKIPLFAIAVASSISTLIAQRPALGSFEQLPLSLRIDNAVLAYLTYLRQMFWPAKLAVFYPISDNAPPMWQLFLAVALLVAITAFAFLLRQKRPYLIVGWLWYLVMLVPVIGIVQVGLQSHADRYTYLPQIGLYLMIVWGVSDLVANWQFRNQIATAAAVVALVAFSLAARAQVSYWRDSEILWNYTITVTKDNYFAHASLADLLMRRGRVNESIEQSEEALRIRPNDANGQNNLGLALLQLGKTKDAAAHFEKALQIDPRLMNAEVNLAWVLATSSDGSLRNGARAVQLSEDVMNRAGHPNAIVLRTLAAAYAEAGRFNDAINAAQQAIEIARVSGNEGLIVDLQRSIAAYQSNQPIRSGP